MMARIGKWPIFILLAGCSFTPSDAEIATACGVSEQDMEQAQAKLLSKPVGSFSSVGKCKLVKTQDNTVLLATAEQIGQER
ncbi:hypothetical protein EEB18_016120 [Sphingopyxis sp. OPL5]|uniref:hypothetical protein n=1 Tax=Sphingopyxis sp. OPL5 TaxID=2486273 RepID=UPI00164DA8D4|nr:hypothetical protein [Sphingopyxis sp. OPL5]QNO26286.1 hypothetical protein EEB18_016120 [Sphingopyxis sp. OPL5]